MIKALAQRLLFDFGIEARIVSIIRMSGARQHKMFKIILDNQSIYVIKQFNSKCYLGTYNLDHVEATEKFSAYVNQQLDCSVVALTCNNKLTVSNSGITYAIYPWCDFVSVYDLTESHCRSLGELLVSIHQLPSTHLPLTAHCLKPFKTTLWTKILANFLNKDELKTLIRLSERCFEYCTLSKTTKVLSHCDINLDNILWVDGTKPLLIDWESAGLIEPRVELLGLAFNAGGIASGKCDLSRVLALIKAYSTKLLESINFSEELYIQSYVTWFYWIDYCLSVANVLSEAEIRKEIKISLRALKILEMYKFKII